MRSKELIKSILLLVFISLIFYVLYMVRLGLLYIFISIILTLIINPVNKFLLYKIKINNNLSSLISVSFLISFFMLIIGLFVPILNEQGKNLSLLNNLDFRKKIKETSEFITSYLDENNISILNLNNDFNFISEFDFTFITNLFNSIISQVGNFGIGILSVLFISYFLLRDGNKIFKKIISLFPNKENKKLTHSFNKIEKLLTRYFSGVLLQIIILFIFYFILLIVLKVENSFAIAFLCAILNIIPYLGPLISILLILIFSATSSIDAFIFSEFTWNSILLISGFAIIQLIDNFLLQPYIFSSSIKSHPLEVFIVIIFSGLLFGIFGLIIAIPLYTTFKVIYNSFFDTKKLLQNLFK